MSDDNILPLKRKRGLGYNYDGYYSSRASKQAQNERIAQDVPESRPRKRCYEEAFSPSSQKKEEDVVNLDQVNEQIQNPPTQVGSAPENSTRMKMDDELEISGYENDFEFEKEEEDRKMVDENENDGKTLQISHNPFRMPRHNPNVIRIIYNLQ